MKTVLRWLLFVPVNLTALLAEEVLAVCEDIGAWLKDSVKEKKA